MRILLVGDTHGNTDWIEHIVLPVAERERVDLIFQLGDFGLWRKGDRFIESAAGSKIPFYFIDGNHENYRILPRGRGGLSCVAGALFYVPRGTIFDWGGVRVVAVGGAHSIDRAYRTPGIDWFAEEDLSAEDVNCALEAVSCDVMLTHDAPSFAELPLGVPTDPIWRAEMDACKNNRDNLGIIADSLQPGLIAHGHYHARWDLEVTRPWGDLSVVGLDRDGSNPSASMVVLECSQGLWEISRLRLTAPF